MSTARIKGLIMHMCEVLGVNSILRLAHRSDIAVLMYHGVVRDNAPFDAWTQVRESRFFTQMKYLQRHYEVIGLDSVGGTVGMVITNSRPKVLITFDDGYRNNYSVVFPILKHFGFPSIIFLATDFIGNRGLYWFDRVIGAVQSSGCSSIDLRATGLKLYHFPKEKGLSRWDAVQGLLTDLKTLDSTARDKVVDRFVLACDNAPSVSEHLATLDIGEISEMARSGLVEFGSHTHGHEILTRLPMVDMKKSICTSLEIIEGIIGSTVRCFAYPNGDYNESVIQVLRDMGVRYAFTTNKGFWDRRSPNLKIPRIAVGGYDDYHAFAAAASGLRDL